MADIVSSNFHVDYSDVWRHYHPGSETFTGADAFITALQSGWQVRFPIYFEQYWHAGTRPVTIYHAILERGDEQMDMAVCDNPWITRQIARNRVEPRPISELRRRRSNQGLEVRE
jgi:hypothetical protein